MFSFRFTCLNVQKQHNFSHIVHCCSACFHPLSERSAFVSVPLRAPSIKAQSVMVVELSQVAIQAACISTWSVLILDSIYVTPRTSTAVVGGPHGPGPTHLHLCWMCVLVSGSQTKPRQTTLPVPDTCRSSLCPLRPSPVLRLSLKMDQTCP